MEFVFQQKELLAAIETAAKTADPNHDLLSFARLVADPAGTLVIYAADFVQSFEHEARVDVRRGGDFGVNAVELRTAVATMPDGKVTATLDANGSRLRLVSGRTKAHIGATDAALLSRPVWEAAVAVDAPRLRRAINFLRPMASTDKTRPHLNAIQILATVAAATNGQALTVVEEPLGVPQMLLPLAAANAWLAALDKITGDVVIRTGKEGTVALETPAGRFGTKTVDAAFPDWRQIVPQKHEWSVTFDAAAFRAASAGMPREWMSMTPGDGHVVVESESADASRLRSTVVDWTVKRGAPRKIGFGVTLLRGAIPESGEVTLSGDNALDPVTLRYADNPTHIAVVMPARW